MGFLINLLTRILYYIVPVGAGVAAYRLAKAKFKQDKPGLNIPAVLITAAVVVAVMYLFNVLLMPFLYSLVVAE